MRRPQRGGFTLIELLVVIAILAILIALLVPAVQKVREAASRTQCINGMKQMGLALHNYHDQQKSFPPALVNTQDPGYGLPPPPDQYSFFSWMTRILPYLEQQALYDQVDLNAWPWWQQPLNGIPMPLFVCPSDQRTALVSIYQDGNPVALTDFLAVNGTDQLAFNGIIHANSQVRLSQIVDGTSNTLMVGERPPSVDLVYGWWFAGSGDTPYFGATDVCLGVNEVMDPNNPAQRDILRPGDLIDPQNQHRWHFWSLHPGGTNFLMGDGSVRFVTYDVGQDVINAAATRGADDPNSLPY